MYTNNLRYSIKSMISNKKILLQSKHALHELLKYILFLEKPVFNVFLKIIGAQNQLPITFCLDLMLNKTLKARNSTPTHTNF